MQTIKFPGRYTSLAKISKFVKKIAKSNGFDGLALYTIETAVDEACSNIIEHAYQGEDNGDIEVTLGMENNRLVIILKDFGQTFDPNLVELPNLSDNISERKAHGLGLYMMKQWMDEVHFEFRENANVLTMVKYKGV